MKIKVFAIGRDSSGASAVHPCEVECTKQQYADGLHYEAAMDDESDLTESVIAVDEHDPGFEFFLKDCWESGAYTELTI